MNTLKQFVRLQLNVIILLVSMFLFSVSANADTETIKLSDGVYADEAITWNGLSCSIVQSKGSTLYKVNSAYISAPRWYKYHKIYFRANQGFQLSSVKITCTTKGYATDLVGSTYSSSVTKKSSKDTDVTITTSGDFEIELGALVYVSSISVTYTTTDDSDIPMVSTSASTLDFGISEVGVNQTKSLIISATNLTSDLILNVSGADASLFDVTPKTISCQNGKVEATEVTVSYTPSTNGKHSASLFISSGNQTLSNISLKGQVAIKHTITWSVNEQSYSEGSPSMVVAEGDRVEVLPTTPAAIGDNQFVGWTTEPILSAQSSKPAVLFISPDEAPVVTADVTYYAVFAAKGTGTQWTKLSSSDIDEGVYVITNEDGNAFTGVISSGKGRMTGDAFDFDESNIATSAPQRACEITILKSETEGGYLLYNAAYGYLYAAAAKTGNLGWQSTENSYWVYDEAKDVIKYASNNAFMLIGSDSGSPCLNTYSYKGGKQLFFVKKENVGSYTTKVDTPTPSETYEPHDFQFVAHNASGYWATMSNDKTLFIPTNVTASTVVVDNDKLNINTTAFGQPQTVDIEGEQVSGVYIPANTGVLLSSSSQEVKYYEVANKTISALTADENMLKAAPIGGGVFDDNADYMYYKLSYEDYTQQSGLGFYWGADEGGVFNIKANTAYLAVPNDKANNAKSFLLDGSTTTIDHISTTNTEQPMYNILGIKVKSANRSGLYIVGGKKIVRN